MFSHQMKCIVFGPASVYHTLVWGSDVIVITVGPVLSVSNLIKTPTWLINLKRQCTPSVINTPLSLFVQYQFTTWRNVRSLILYMLYRNTPIRAPTQLALNSHNLFNKAQRDFCTLICTQKLQVNFTNNYKEAKNNTGWKSIYTHTHTHIHTHMLVFMVYGDFP